MSRLAVRYPSEALALHEACTRYLEDLADRLITRAMGLDGDDGKLGRAG